jgi:hypothetical protein
MKTICSALISLILCSCGNPFIPLKSDYGKIDKTFVSRYDKETTWSKLLDILVQTETPLDIVDKSSGLLVSKPVDMTNYYTYEDDYGNVLDRSKMVVLSQYKAGLPLHPTQLTATWNIRMSEANNQTVISVNLVNVKAIHYTPINAYSPVINYDVKSLGTFERMVKERVAF